MGTIASQITSLTIVYSTVYSGPDHRKHQSSASLAFEWGIHRGPVNSPPKWPVTRKMFPFDDVIMPHAACCSCHVSFIKQGKSEERDTCNRPCNHTQIDSNRQLISPCGLEIWWTTSQNNKTPLLYYIKLGASLQIHRWIQTVVIGRKCSVRVKIGDFFVPHDIEIRWRTLKNNRAPFLLYIALCAAFQSHWFIQTGVTVRSSQFGSKLVIFCPAWPGKLTDDLEKQ